MISSLKPGPSTLALATSVMLVMVLPSLAVARTRHHGREAERPAEKPTTPGASSKPMLVGTYGNWGAYTAQGGKAKICYALAQPKDRSPASLKKDQAYIFISNRPSEGVRNEVSVIMGVPLKEGAAEARAEIGSSSFDLVAKGQNAWMKNAADESRFIDTMKRSAKLTVRGTLVKGGTATDSYALPGLAQALDRIVKDCQ